MASYQSAPRRQFVALTHETVTPACWKNAECGVWASSPTPPTYRHREGRDQTQSPDLPGIPRGPGSNQGGRRHGVAWRPRALEKHLAEAAPEVTHRHGCGGRLGGVLDVPSGDRAESVLASARGVCQQCVRLAAVDGVGVSVVSPTGGLSTLCATDATSSAIEEMQFTLGVGPCLDAQSLGVPVFLEDLTRLSGALEQRWPGFTDLVSLTVARALFALPLRIGAIVLGAMDLYRTTPGPLSASELAAALRAADTVALVMVGLDVPDSGPLAGGGTGSAFRMEVHQAAGMVMEQMQVPIEAALLLLRGKAYAQDVSVNDVAADVVARRLVFAGEDG